MTPGFFDTVSLALMLLSGVALETRVDGYPAPGEDSETQSHSLEVSSDFHESSRQVEVWLRSLAANELFTRFRLSAHNERGERVGQWINSQYDGNVRINTDTRTVTNANNAPKQMIGASWRSPSNDVGPVEFRARVFSISDTVKTPVRQEVSPIRVQSRASFRGRG